MIIGIDDAHRCPVVGSLCCAGVKMDYRESMRLKQIGVRDSKLLTREQRFYYFSEILKHCRIGVYMITADTISKSSNINDEEMKAYLDIIDQLYKIGDEVIIDNFDTNKDKFVSRMKHIRGSPIRGHRNWKIEHKADENYVACSAASIVARTISDIEMDNLRLEFDLGSGNPFDIKTIDFIKKHLCHKKCRNGCQHIRWRWITIEKLRKELNATHVKRQ